MVKPIINTIIYLLLSVFYYKMII